MKVLTLNVGSSSVKLGVFRVDAGEASAVVQADIDIHGRQRQLRINHGDGDTTHELSADEATAARLALGLMCEGMEVDAIVHRVVHGGPQLRTHRVIDSEVMTKIGAAAPFAPLHVPPALAWIRHAADALPGVPQVACLDTAFHYPLPEESRVLPLPREWLAKGVERYGFHGLSCESIVAQLDPVPSRLIIAHLGSGASLTAVRDGKSIDTSMGMTPTGGIVMGTRPGDLDPGVLLFLLREGHYDASQLEDLLEHRSGLRGISDLSADVRELRQATDQPMAVLALEQFARSVAREAAGMAVVLGGVDLLVFTGGIGEHDAAMRDRIADLLRACFPSLATRVVSAREDREMALHAVRLLS